jgi:hypothetical protein
LKSALISQQLEILAATIKGSYMGTYQQRMLQIKRYGSTWQPQGKKISWKNPQKTWRSYML